MIQLNPQFGSKLLQRMSTGGEEEGKGNGEGIVEGGWRGDKKERKGKGRGNGERRGRKVGGVEGEGRKGKGKEILMFRGQENILNGGRVEI